MDKEEIIKYCLTLEDTFKDCPFPDDFESVTMKHCKKIWNNYYILKMDVAKYFDNIDKKILLKIIDKKIKDKELMWLIKQILYSQKREKGLEIRELYFTNVCKYIFK